jgi:hypothetical protein
MPPRTTPTAAVTPYVLERTPDEDLLLPSVGWANSYYLPFGAPAEVEGEVVTQLKTIGKGGGLIIESTHHVQLDTPLENSWAMVNTITETPYGTY